MKEFMKEFDAAALGIRVAALITTAQFDELVKLKFDSVFNGVYVDDVIDWLRRKHKIVIYDKIEPFVDPKTHVILYRMGVKKCNLRDGWNGRIYIGESRLTKNIYAAKREAIWLAIRWIKMQNKSAKGKSI